MVDLSLPKFGENQGLLYKILQGSTSQKKSNSKASQN